MTNTDRKALCLRYFLIGLNATEISKITGYSSRTVQSFIQSKEWQSLKSGHLENDTKQVWKMYKGGFKPKDIAIHFCRSIRWVHDKLAKARKVQSKPPMDVIIVNYPLFEHMVNEHGVLLLNSEIQEIENLVRSNID